MRRVIIAVLLAATVGWSAGSGAPTAQAAAYGGTVVAGSTPAYCSWTAPCVEFMRHAEKRCSVEAYNLKAAFYRDAGVQTAIVDVGPFAGSTKLLQLIPSNTGIVNVEFFTTNAVEGNLPQQGWCTRLDVTQPRVYPQGSTSTNISIPSSARWMTITPLAGVATVEWHLL